MPVAAPANVIRDRESRHHLLMVVSPEAVRRATRHPPFMDVGKATTYPSVSLAIMTIPISLGVKVKRTKNVDPPRAKWDREC